ncbi:MAG: cysteine desulfurase NifS [Candidatus Omnitrophota bacterium]
MGKLIYLDHAATTPARPEVIKAMMPFFTDKFGNPSSVYSLGHEAKRCIEESRQIIAGALNAKAEEIIFTSGGTEADNFALQGIAFANKNKGRHIITTAIEHHAVLETACFLEENGFKVTYLKVDKYGCVNSEDVKKAITEDTILVSVMHANNEIGTIQPIEEISKITRERGVYFHVDAVQTFGHINLDVDKLGVDLLSVSAHKLYGPKGTGAIYIRKGTKITPFMRGGGQERNLRASTENVAGIAGFSKAVELALSDMEEEVARLKQLRDYLIKGILEKIEDVSLNGHPELRVPNNVNVCVKYIEGESILLNLDAEGICASSGSACTSGSLEPSHVLLACGVSPEIAHGSLRMSLGASNTKEDVDFVLEVLPPIVRKLRLMSPLYKGK